MQGNDDAVQVVRVRMAELAGKVHDELLSNGVNAELKRDRFGDAEIRSGRVRLTTSVQYPEWSARPTGKGRVTIMDCDWRLSTTVEPAKGFNVSRIAERFAEKVREAEAKAERMRRDTERKEAVIATRDRVREALPEGMSTGSVQGATADAVRLDLTIGAQDAVRLMEWAAAQGLDLR